MPPAHGPAQQGSRSQPVVVLSHTDTRAHVQQHRQQLQGPAPAAACAPTPAPPARSPPCCLQDVPLLHLCRPPQLTHPRLPHHIPHMPVSPCASYALPMCHPAPLPPKTHIPPPPAPLTCLPLNMSSSMLRASLKSGSLSKRSPTNSIAGCHAAGSSSSSTDRETQHNTTTAVGAGSNTHACNGSGSARRLL